MPKVKLPRKGTFVDMTAMCDVAFLLLTFFILATKIKPNEPVEVRTPSSTSTQQIPDDYMLLTLSKDGRVYFSLDNLNLRQKLIEYINDGKGLKLTSNEVKSFKEAGSIGLPFNQLKSYLDLHPSDRAKYDKEAPGIPVDTTGNFETNELAYWVRAARIVGSMPDEDGRSYDLRIAIKADGESAYPYMQKIIGTLGKLKIFRFNFVTESKGVPAGTALAQQQQRGGTAAGQE